jgi:hypothetical protein
MGGYDYIPTNLADFVGWLRNFVTQLIVYKTEVGASDAEVETFQNDLVWLQYYADNTELIESTTADFNRGKEIFQNSDFDAEMPDAPAFIIPKPPDTKPKAALRRRIRRAVGRYERADDYTDNIGRALGVVKDPTRVNLADMKPTKITVAAEGGDRIVVTYSKQGKADALLAEREIDGKWTRIGTPNYSPWVDDTPSPEGKSEKRSYRFRFMIRGEAVGEYTEVFEIYSQP